MDIFTWSLPFIIDKVGQIFIAILKNTEDDQVVLKNEDLNVINKTLSGNKPSSVD